MNGQKRSMPTLSQIERWWVTEGRAELLTLPRVTEGADFGEPFCFRCGWLAPVPDYAEVRDVAKAAGKPMRPEVISAEVWNSASGWLERAHLADRFPAEDDRPSNIVPLCLPCHDAMPPFPEDRAGALLWVAEGPLRSPLWQLQTDMFLPVNGGRPGWKPGKPDYRLAYLRHVERELEILRSGKTLEGVLGSMLSGLSKEVRRNAEG